VTHAATATIDRKTNMSSRETSDSAKKPRLSGPTGFGGDDSASAARASGSNFPEASSAATATSAIDPTVQAALDNLARNIKKEFEGQLNDQKKEFEGQLNAVNERIGNGNSVLLPRRKKKKKKKRAF